jgi:hypothetical protein
VGFATGVVLEIAGGRSLRLVLGDDVTVTIGLLGVGLDGCWVEFATGIVFALAGGRSLRLLLGVGVTVAAGLSTVAGFADTLVRSAVGFAASRTDCFKPLRF